MRNDRDKLDDLIGGALRGYSRASPIEGLEERVLQRIRVAGTPRRSRWPFRLAFAVPAFAALMVAGIFARSWWSEGRPDNTTHLDIAAPWPEPPKLIAKAPGAITPRARNRTRERPGAPPVALPRQQVFPVPSPMTAEEQALIAWAGRAPVEARQAFLDLQKRTDEPVAVQTIQIEPLQSDGAQ